MRDPLKFFRAELIRALLQLLLQALKAASGSGFNPESVRLRLGHLKQGSDI